MPPPTTATPAFISLIMSDGKEGGRIMPLKPDDLAWFKGRLGGSGVVPPPPPQPPTPPVDPLASAIKVAAGTPIPIARLKPGSILALENGGTWGGVLPVRWGNFRVTSYGDPSKPLPILGGVEIAAGVVDVLIDHVRLTPTVRYTGYGVRAVFGGNSGLSFVNLIIEGFEDGVAIHDPRLDGAGPTIPDVTFAACAIYDNRPPESVMYDSAHATRGQGIFCANVDGLSIGGCAILDNGYPQRANQFRHGIYVKATCKDVVLGRSVLAGNACYGAQIRASGSIVADNAFADNNTCLMLNGETASARNNLFVKGHILAVQGVGYNLGCLIASVGHGTISGNRVFESPTPAPAGYFVPPPLHIAPRPNKEGWEWDGECNPSLSDNIVSASVLPGLASILATLRSDVAAGNFDGIEKARSAAFAAAAK